MTLEQRTAIVSPTYNEASNLRALVEGFFASLPSATLLIVDDSSPDGTAQLCRELQARHPGLQLLVRDGPRGLGRAYLAGFAWALERGFEVIGSMDADLSHAPARLPALLAATAHHDVVVGSRYVKDGGTVNWSLRRVLLSWLANRFAGLLLRLPARDVTSGFRLYRAAALARLDLGSITSSGYSFLVELLYRLHVLGASIGEVPIVFCDRTLGRSKLGVREIYVGAFRVLALRARVSPRS